MVYDLTMLKAFYAAYFGEDRTCTERTTASDDFSGENFCMLICMMGIK